MIFKHNQLLMSMNVRVSTTCWFRSCPGRSMSEVRVGGANGENTQSKMDLGTKHFHNLILNLFFFSVYLLIARDVTTSISHSAIITLIILWLKVQTRYLLRYCRAVITSQLHYSASNVDLISQYSLQTKKYIYEKANQDVDKKNTMKLIKTPI